MRGADLAYRFERLLFGVRWLLAPLYAGMALALVAILIVFTRELIGELAHIGRLSAEQVILLALSLIDLSLVGNLLLVVIFAGYESFVSKLHIGDHEDRPTWLGTIDFSDLKIKVIASIVAISAIALLRSFLLLADATSPVEPERFLWLVVIQLTFVASGVMLALMDRIRTKVTPADEPSPGGHL